MEAGLPRQVLKFAVGQQTYDCEWVLTSAEYTTFKEFFHTDLNNGVDFFDLSIPTEAGVEEVTVRFVGGVYDDRYRPHDQWQIRATLERQVVQEVEAPDTPLSPVWYQPEQDIFINTTLDISFANNLLHCHPSEGENIFLTVPEVETPSDLLPIGVINYGPGNVVIRVNEDTEVVDPDETWMSLAAEMGAWAIYRMDTGVTTDEGKVQLIQDLSANAHNLGDYTTDEAKKATIVGGWLRTTQGTYQAFLGTPKRDGDGVEEYTINNDAYAVLLITRFPDLAAETGQIFTTAYQTGGSNLRSGIFLGDTQWSVRNAAGNGTTMGTWQLPVSGTASRLIEQAVMGTNTFTCCLINGYPTYATSGANTLAMDRLQLGGWGLLTGAGSKLFVPTMEVAGVVVFAGSTVADLYQTAEGQKNLARLRQLMQDEFP
jgi:hypothetical protein